MAHTNRSKQIFRCCSVACMALLAVPLSLGMPQAAQPTRGGIAANGDIYMYSPSGERITMAAATHCIEAQFSVDAQTAACTVPLGSEFPENMQSKLVEVYRNGGARIAIHLPSLLDRWQLWNGGAQIAIAYDAPDGRPIHALYDCKTGSLVEKFAEPADKSTMPLWAKDRLELDNESVATDPASIEMRKRWMAKTLQQIMTIKPGMRREDLVKIFTPDGGLSFPFDERFVLIECPYIKVDVKFKPARQGEDGFAEDPDDIIESISRPYLEWPYSD